MATLRRSSSNKYRVPSPFFRDYGVGRRLESGADKLGLQAHWLPCQS